MRSIIDLVSEAEQNAMQIRKDAREKARDAVAEAQQQVKEQKDAQHEKAREVLRERLKQAEAEGRKVADEVREASKKEALAFCDAARAKLPDAVGYLMERAMEV